MEHYFEISIEGVSAGHYGRYLEWAFRAAHKAIWDHGEGQVGLSFPGYRMDKHQSKTSLGERILVISSDRDRLVRVLEAFNREAIVLKEDLVVDEGVEVVPEGSRRCYFFRSQIEKKLRKNLKSDRPEVAEGSRRQLRERLIRPVIYCESTSNANRYPVVVDMAEANQRPGKESSAFSRYGLSRKGNESRSVPVF